VLYIKVKKRGIESAVVKQLKMAAEAQKSALRFSAAELFNA